MLRYFNLWLSLGCLMVFTVCYLSLTSSPPKLDVDFKYIDKIEHWLAYFVLMIWFSQLYKSVRTRFFYLLFFILMGVALEVLQGLGGIRFFEYSDMLANTLGAATAWLITKYRLNNLLFSFEKLLLK